MSEGLSIASDVIGWIYLLAWSSSFYGQVYESWKCKSVEGLNLNFQLLNLSGFSFYSIYNSAGYFYHNESTGDVTIQDLIFAYHALFIVCVQWVQCFIYKRGDNKLYLAIYMLNIAMWEFIFLYTCITYFEGIHLGKAATPVAMMGYMKLFISFIKYMPQVYWNYQRKCTVGWSIFNIILDFTGGSFSLLQLVIDSFNQTNNTSFTGGLNITKFCLSVFSMFFDMIFMFQHYVLYKDKNQIVYQQMLLQQHNTDDTEQMILDSNNNQL